jgi:hypothetical protein
MVTRVYKSTDSGAPVLTGQAGSLHTLLQAILIDGIGGAPASPWTVEFSDVTSKTKVYRPPAGNRHYLQVKDNGPVAANMQESAMRGFGAMTAYDTGTDPFPTTTQQTNGIIVRKSASADSTPRAWRAYVDEKTMYLFIDTGDTAGAWSGYGFGQFVDWATSGAWGSLIFGRIVAASILISSSTNSFANVVPSGTTTMKVYGPRGYSQTGTAVEYTVYYDSAAFNSTATDVPGAFGQGYPYAVDGGIILCPARLALSGVIVGRMRGVWIPGHNRPLVLDDTFNAVEGTLTRGMVAQNYMATGQLMMETTATWDSE